MSEDLPPYAEQLIEGRPDRPLEAPRARQSCVIEEVWQESRAYIGLRVTIDEAFADSYERPGQYVTLSPNHVEPRFLVIASGPGEASADGWEFLVDRHTSLGQSIDPLQTGALLEISAPEGPGYPVDSVAGRPLLCFATGSGIASIRPAIQYWQAHPDEAPSEIAIYYGESGPDDFAFTGQMADWQDRGIRLYRCDSSIDPDREGYRYVQHAFEADDPDLTDAAVFMSGASVMKRMVIEHLLERGFPLESIVTNI